MSRAYEVRIRWRSPGGSTFVWNLQAIATSSAALAAGLIGYVGPNASIAVKALDLYPSPPRAPRGTRKRIGVDDGLRPGVSAGTA